MLKSWCSRIIRLSAATTSLAALASPTLAHVTLLAPNGGESLAVGSQFTVRWTIDIAHNQMNWDLWYSSTGGGGPWIPIAVDLPPGDTAVGSIHEFVWTIPNDPSKKVRVRVRMDNSGTDYWDVSDMKLSIVPSCCGDRYCDPNNPNSTGMPAELEGHGSDVAADNALVLHAYQLPQNVFGYFLNSDMQGSTTPPGSSGILCLSGGIGRHAKQIANSGGAGEIILLLDLTNLPRPNGPHSVVAGETWNFQCWFRDKVGGMPTSNFTNGLSVLFQ